MKEDDPNIKLSLTEKQCDQIYSILYPGDCKERVAFLLCGHRAGDYTCRLMVKEIIPLPECAYNSLSNTHVHWSTDGIVDILEKADKDQLSFVKIHSHPNSYPQFSKIDDESDKKLFPYICDWIRADIPHLSAVMLPDKKIFARYFWKREYFKNVERITVIGHKIIFHGASFNTGDISDSLVSQKQAFGKGTTRILQNLSIAVVGCSGTGSIVVEQLIRLGVKKITLVDDDIIEDKNINRILNSKKNDIGQYKTTILKEAIERIGLGTDVLFYEKNLLNPDVVKAVAQCDLVFGCMDTHSGRLLLNRLATFYTLPYFDIGVRLDADGSGGIKGIWGHVDYLIPGMSSLRSRERVSEDRAKAELLKQTNPQEYEKQLREQYIRGVDEPRPAVISVNMLAASLAVNDFLARIHPYRPAKKKIASIDFCLVELDFIHKLEDIDIYKQDKKLIDWVGAGDVKPLLNRPVLSE